MSDLSDWIWLVVAGLWVLLKVVPRLFRAKTKAAAAPAAKRAPAQPATPTTIGSPERVGDFGPKPIEPK